MGVEQVNQQQLAVAGNLSAVQGLEKMLEGDFERKIDTDNTAKVEESAIRKAIDGKAGKVGTEIIAGLAAKLAQNMPTAKLLNNLRDNYDFVLNQRDESSADNFDLKNPIQVVHKAAKNKQNSEQQSDSSGGGDRSDQRGTDIKEYIGAYSQLLVGGGAEIKKKTEQLENHLVREKGVTVKELQSVKAQVANTVRHEIMLQVKQAYLKQVLAQGKSIEWLISKKEVNNFIDFAFLNDKLGGWDFGGQDDNLQGAVERVKADSHRDLREFLKDSLEHAIMKKSMSDGDKKVEKDIEEYLKLGAKIGLDLKAVLDKIPQMKEHLGLNPAIEFNYVEPGGEQGDQQRRRGYQYTAEEEKEVLTDKLRAIYLRRALHGNTRSILETQFKMIKLKNGLIRLGVRNFAEVETEGKALARVKLFEMLREAFEERATYSKLSGAAWKMTERKIKTVLSNLERVGVALSETELNLVRDKANVKMYREAEHELGLLNTAIEARGERAYLTSKKKLTLGILERIAAESELKRPGEELNTFKEAC